ncbi:MAG: alpha/beta hydrolase [Rhodoferax sp.]|jgi:pimeloyl-ACP methyl ester carboxylesterase|nr:alpha/beta hydrolase [Rhodoferax sp.]
MKHDTILADDGEQLHVHRSGSGTPILLLHGWTANHAWWSLLLKSLGTHYHFLRPDARGHGGHPLNINPTPDIKRLGQDIINLLDHYGIERAVAVGHSMGALTLWQCIRDFGCQRFSHLCLIDQSPKLLTDDSWHGGIYGNFDHAQADRLEAELNTDFVEAVLRLAALGLNDKARETYLRNSAGWRVVREALRSINPTSAIAIWKTLMAADYRDVLHSINVPTLLAYGTASNFYTTETAHFVAARIPQARLSFYEGADHSPHLCAPERFAKELTELIEGK